MAELKNTTINDTGAAQLPVGNTAQRPVSPNDGYMWFNTDENKVEYYTNGLWIKMPDIVRKNLAVYLDANNVASYPGTGNTWFDLSGRGRNYSIGPNISWNSSGYFSCNGGTFTGPASNTFGFSSYNEHTIEVFAKTDIATSNNFFYWEATPNTGTDTRAIQTHLFYGNGNTYYDVSGCCTATQRIQYPNDFDLTSGIKHLVWRTRKNAFPNRQFFKNTLEQMNSGSNNTATVNWNLSTPATIGNSWVGDIYLFRVYNRALSDEEIQQNFNSNRIRFGI